MTQNMMKNTLKTLLLASLAGVVVNVAAQPGPGMGHQGMPGHEMRRGMQPPPGHDPATRISHDLELDEAQAGEIRAIFEEERAQLDALGEATDEEFCSIHEQTRAQVASVLTGDQLARLAEIEAQHDRRPPPMQEGAPTQDRRATQERGHDKGERGNRQGPGGMDAHRPGPPVCP